MGENLNDLVEQWRAVVKQRRELDSLSKQLKEGPEADLVRRILMKLDMEDLPGAKTRHGFVTRTTKTHLEIADKEKFLQYQQQRMLDAATAAQPLSDVLLLQSTPLKSGIVELVQGIANTKDLSDEEFNRIAEPLMGIRRVSDADLSFKSK